MHILIYRWKAYNYYDIEQTFQQLGHSVDHMEQPLGNYEINPGFEAKIESQMRACTYDLVFTVNYFPLISDVCQRLGVRYVSWTCDNPLISMYHESVFHDCNYIFTFDKTNYYEFSRMGVKHIWYLPLAVNTNRLDQVMANGRNLERYQADVAFVGRLYDKNSYDEVKHVLPDYLRGYLEATMEAQLNVSGGNIIGSMLTTDILEQIQEYFHLEKSERSFSDLELIFETTVLGMKVAEIQRRRALIELSKQFEVSVYTDCDTRDLMRVKNCGLVEYWDELPLVFHQSRINLNFTIPNIKSGIPLRVWDVLGAGGFLMTNYQAEIPLYFTEGEDLVCFDGVDDLCEKVRYYLEHEEERLRIARNGYEKVKAHHGYVERIGRMLELMGKPSV